MILVESSQAISGGVGVGLVGGADAKEPHGIAAEEIALLVRRLAHIVKKRLEACDRLAIVRVKHRGHRPVPAIHDFSPDLILISAGFDAHHRDPLAHIELQDADYRWITDATADVAEVKCHGRIASILEGGYDLQALASASRAHVQGLSG